MNITPDVRWTSESRRAEESLAAATIIPPEVKGLNVRIGEITVLDIQRGFLSPRSADVYPLFLVAAADVDNPIVLKPVRVFNDIESGQRLPLPNVAAPTIFRAPDTLPAWLDVHVVLMKSRARQRDLAVGILDALASSEGKAIQTAIMTSLTAANPVAGVVGNLSVALLNLVCRVVSNEEDTQLFYSHASIERADGYCLGQDITLTDDRNAVVVLEVQPIQ